MRKEKRKHTEGRVMQVRFTHRRTTETVGPHSICYPSAATSAGQAEFRKPPNLIITNHRIVPFN